jgi:drug/metabolite transporter (DMT)-like permease
MLNPTDMRRSNLIGMGWMFLAGLCFSGMHASIRYVGQDLHPFEIAFFRNLFGLLALSPLFLRYGFAPLKATRPGLLSIRAVLNLGAMLAFFSALTLAPLADVAALGFTAPIFATALAIPVLGETVGWRRTAAIAVGFLGAMIIIRPGFSEIDLGHGLVLVSSLLWAVAMLVIKQISKTDSSLTITLYMGIMLTPLSLPFALAVWIWPQPHHWVWLVGIGILGGLAQLGLTEALRRGETAVVMPMDFFKLLWAALLGFFIFGQQPGLYTVLGGLVIFGAATYIALRETRLSKPLPATSRSNPT